MVRFLFNPFRVAIFPVVALRRYWRHKLTSSSNLVILLVIAALNVVWGFPLLGLLASFLLLMSVSLFTNWWMRPKLRIVVRMPNLVACGVASEGTVVIENIGSMPVFDLSLIFDDTLWLDLSTQQRQIESIEPREQVAIGFTFIATARGEFQFPTIECQSTFPFNLFRSWQYIPQTNHYLVTPQLCSVDSVRVSELARVAGEVSGGLRTGDSFEYAGSREWFAGDAPRTWDYAAWARLGRPIVREFQQMTSGHIDLFVDALVTDATSSSGSAEFERRLSVAASIIDALRWTPCAISLMMIQSQCICTSQSTYDHTERLLAVLAQARPEPIPRHAKGDWIVEMHRNKALQIGEEQVSVGSPLVIITTGNRQPLPEWIEALMNHCLPSPILFEASGDE